MATYSNEKFRLFFLFFCSLILTNCKEITTILPSPSITLTSVKQITFKTFEIEIDFDPGDGQVIKSIELELQDLTILNSPKIIENVEIKDFSKSSVIKHFFNAASINHDFKITALLNTNKYQYHSEPVIYRSLKNNFYINIVKDEFYYDINSGLAIQINKGGSFDLIINYLNSIKEKVEVKLNNSIRCENDVDLTNFMNIEGTLITSGRVKVPDGILPGEYAVNITIGGLEFEYDKKIRILEGDWFVFNDNYPGERRGDYAWFRIGNQLYVVGGNYNSSTTASSPVWSLDLISGKWTKKNDFNWPPERYPNAKKIFSNELIYKNQGYILAQSDDRKIEIWRYDNLNDIWNKVTEYPGIGADRITCFNIDEKVFVGGGVKLELNNDHNVFDFWSFDIENGTWQQMKDLPVRQLELWRESITSTTLNDKGYVLEFPYKLWEYDSKSDSWIIIANFPGPLREMARLIAYNNNIYMIGGYYSYLGYTSYKDCWLYSFNEKNWKMKAFLPNYTNHNVAFSFNNSIYVGLGYAHNVYQYIDEPKIYKLTL